MTEEPFMSMDEFCRLAKEAVEQLPDEFQEWMENVVVDVRENPSRRQLKSVGLDPEEETLLGLFEGRPVTDMPEVIGDAIGDWQPNRVWLFKQPIEEACRSREEVAYEIKRTIIHELAHHFGWSEEDLDEFESQPNPFDKDHEDDDQ
ncbi:MAG: metallopeptidase family protein [Planctomycetia bacterium]|nr:metallopeptidase family protein [Planctomycetia bacterium]